MTLFRDLVNDMQDEMELQFIKLDQFTSSSFDWLDQLINNLQLNLEPEKIDDNEPQEITLDTQNQNESAILPSKSESYQTLESQMNEFDDILSNDKDGQSENDEYTKPAIKSKISCHQSKENIPDNNALSNIKPCISNIPEVEIESIPMINSSNNSDQNNLITNFEISDFVSELSISALRFREQWKESIARPNKSKSPF